MDKKTQVKFLSKEKKDGYYILSISVSMNDKRKKYKIYAFDNDILYEIKKLSDENLTKFAIIQMKKWLKDSNNNLPKDRYRILINYGVVTTNNIQSFLTIQKENSDLVRTNITISAPLFEWAKAKAKKESTSLSDLVSRGLITLKDSEKEIDAWIKEQGSYVRKKLAGYGSFEVFHYMPNNYKDYKTETLKDALKNAELDRTGWPIGAYLSRENLKPRPQSDGGIKAEYTGSFFLRFDYWYAKTKGEFYFSRNLDSDSKESKVKPNSLLYFDTLVWRVAEAIEHCISYYRSLNVNEQEQIKIKLTLYGLRNRVLSAWNPSRASTLFKYVCDTEKSSWETEISLENLIKTLDEVIYDAVKKLVLMFDFFVPSEEVITDILNREYRKSRT
ncbi:MAG: hypothetical protein ABIE03_06020 [Patescibacteria group bacterium]|nr:hypothetical protein [Patescibacteria group bacterium]